MINVGDRVKIINVEDEMLPMDISVGIEGTVNRVDDRYDNEMCLVKFDERSGDWWCKEINLKLLKPKKIDESDLMMGD